MPPSYPCRCSRRSLRIVPPMEHRDRDPPSRLDAEGRRQVAPTWESLVERQIREAMEDGQVRRPAYRGRAAAARGRCLRRRLGDGVPCPAQRRRGAAMDRGGQGGPAAARAPRRHPRACRPIGARPGRRRAIARSSTALVAELNAAVARLNAEAPTDRQHRRPARPRIEELARLDRAPRGMTGRVQSRRRAASRPDIRVRRASGVRRARDPADRPRRLARDLRGPPPRRDDRVVPRPRVLRGARRAADRAPRDVGRGGGRGRVRCSPRPRSSPTGWCSSRSTRIPAAGRGLGSGALAAIAAAHPGVPVGGGRPRRQPPGRDVLRGAGVRAARADRGALGDEHVAERRWWLGDPPPVADGGHRVGDRTPAHRCDGDLTATGGAAPCRR